MFLHLHVVNQTAFIVINPTIVTKLQFIRMKTELVYIGRRRTTSFNESDAPVNKNCKYNASNKEVNSNTERLSFLAFRVCGVVH